MHSLRHFAAVIICFLLISLSVASAQDKPQASPDEGRSRPISEPQQGSVAPDFTLKSVSGESVRLSDFRGRVVFLHFWATWCGPCKIAMPWFVDMQNKYGARGLQVIGVSLDDDASAVEIGEFADNLRVNYPILIGDQKTADLYGGIPAMPTAFVIRKDGKTFEEVIGIKDQAEFERLTKLALDSESEDVQGHHKSAGVGTPARQ